MPATRTPGITIGVRSTGYDKEIGCRMITAVR